MKHLAMKRTVLCALLIATALTAEIVGQVQSLTPAELARYTPQNPYDRFSDGRPRVPDKLVETVREMGIEVEEAWGLPRQKGYTN